MAVLIGLVFKDGGRIWYYDSDRFSLEVGDFVVVPTERGMKVGKVVVEPRRIECVKSSSLKKVERRATKNDLEKHERNKKREAGSLSKCQELIDKHKLNMKLVGVDYYIDGSQITFYFVSSGRVDFRALVKDLASTLRTRIELRQIGVRDEAGMIGGIGPCGRDLCCVGFIKEFEPVSIKMAKEQHLPLNPGKISGLCGRLMCCLCYENEFYAEFNSRAPELYETVETEEGKGTVVEFDVLKEKVIVQLESGDRLTLDVKSFPPKEKKEEYTYLEEDFIDEDLSALED